MSMIGENIAIAVAEVVRSKDGIDSNDLNQEIDQRIASVISEIERKSAEIEAVEGEVRALKKSLVPLLGSAFIRRMEEDPVWSTVTSKEFETKFLQNDMPAVVNIANLVKRAHTLSVERAELEERLDHLREDRRHNNYLPGELYRFIQELRTEVGSLKAENESLRRRVTDLESKELGRRQREEEAARREIIARYSFNLFSNLAQTVWTPTAATLTYTGSGHNYAICSVPLYSDRPFRWRVEITALPANNWVFLGVIGKNQGITATSYSDSTTYGWACSGQVYVAGGNHASRDGWTSWQQGDSGLFTYNPATRTLSLKLEKTNKEYSLENMNISSAYIHCNVVHTNTSIRLSADV